MIMRTHSCTPTTGPCHEKKQSSTTQPTTLLTALLWENRGCKERPHGTTPSAQRQHVQCSAQCRPMCAPLSNRVRPCTHVGGDPYGGLVLPEAAGPKPHGAGTDPWAPCTLGQATQNSRKAWIRPPACMKRMLLVCVRTYRPVCNRLCQILRQQRPFWWIDRQAVPMPTAYKNRYRTAHRLFGAIRAICTLPALKGMALICEASYNHREARTCARRLPQTLPPQPAASPSAQASRNGA